MLYTPQNECTHPYTWIDESLPETHQKRRRKCFTSKGNPGGVHCD